MTPEFEKKIYQGTLRSVIWGAERDDVMHNLEVNGITGDQADGMFRRARKERITQIRTDAVKKAILGLLLLVAAGVLFAVFWYGFGAITRLIYIICFAVGAWGAWWLLDGLISALLAPKKKGSLADQ